MGFADMGSFGSEIKTPNLDSLAKAGVRFTNFYTHASCSPTRSVLLSGVDTHLNGLGNMDEWTAPNQRGAVGYEGYLNNRVVTLPQLLKDAGYHTYMVGKWHLGKAPNRSRPRADSSATSRCSTGRRSYWDMWNFTGASPKSIFTEDGRYLTQLPKDYYATKTYTDKLIGFIDANRGDGKPFFAYVAHQAPHDPYHLPSEWRNRHVGEYVRQGLGRGAPGAAEAADRARHHAGGTRVGRAHVVPARSHRARAGEPGDPRQENGTLRRARMRCR